MIFNYEYFRFEYTPGDTYFLIRLSSDTVRVTIDGLNADNFHAVCIGYIAVMTMGSLLEYL